MNKLNHYIGITGIRDQQEMELILERCPVIILPEDFQFNVGLLMSNETLKDNQSPNPLYPTKQELYNLIESFPSGWNAVIHYHTSEKENLSDQLKHIYDFKKIYSRNLCRTLQLNVMTPDPLELIKIKNHMPDLDIILQVPLWWNKFSSLNNIQQFIKDYNGIVSHFLFDPSGGRGDEGSLSREVVNIIYKILPILKGQSDIAIAGGISGKNVYDICLEVHEILHHLFSMDAQTRIRGRTYKGRKMKDRINPDKVYDYLNNAVRAYKNIMNDKPFIA